MNTNGAKPTITDLPLDLFGDVEETAVLEESDEQPQAEPNPFCSSCGSMLTPGLATCVWCGSQNAVVPIVTSKRPVLPEPDEPEGSYPDRVAFAFLYIALDIVGQIVRFISRVEDTVIGWTISGPDQRKR
jgi:hypothetical protein